MLVEVMQNATGKILATARANSSGSALLEVPTPTHPQGYEALTVLAFGTSGMVSHGFSLHAGSSNPSGGRTAAPRLAFRLNLPAGSETER